MVALRTFFEGVSNCLAREAAIFFESPELESCRRSIWFVDADLIFFKRTDPYL